ncbi:protein LAZ1 [Tanacetum coccineum]
MVLKRGQEIPQMPILMFSIASWNIWGLNQTPKQSEVIQVVNENNLSVCGILKSHVEYHRYPGNSDHSPSVLKFPSIMQSKPKPFNFFNFLTHKSNFMVEFKNAWSTNVEGHNMFKVMSKLKALKTPMRKLMYANSNLHDCVQNLRVELDAVQTALDRNPNDTYLREEEVVYLSAFSKAKIDEERYLKHKAKIQWFDVGDLNSAYFYKTIKSKNSRSRIDVLLDSSNNEVTGTGVSEAFVNHYKIFLGIAATCDMLDTEGLFVKTIPNTMSNDMIRPITNDEIHRAMFDIGDDRAPGLDGFTSALFKKGWSIVGDDVCNAVRDFFTNEKLLKEINHTFIALIPKIPTPTRVTDYRPISCCNIIYKCISKIITNRIIGGIDGVVSLNQSAFVPGRQISDNILITQELMHNYHLNWGPPRCAFKVDIQKTYDTVDWRFLEHILYYFGFHPVMIKWIMACVTLASFSICINGDVHGFIKGKRGLRQGDPLSPFLFTLVMEVLTLILKRRVTLLDNFRFHHRCNDLELINVCFADDLFIFARGDINSVRVIMDGLDEFKRTSGLVPSLPKSTAFFCNVPNHVKNSILSIMPFSEAKNRIGDWKNKSLSFAGRLQLFNSVLSSMQVYWALILRIPNGIVYDIHQLIRGFLWCNGEYKRGKCKFSPLAKWVTPRDVSNAGFNMSCRVADFVVNGEWHWPLPWLMKAPNIGTLTAPSLDPNTCDLIQWKNKNGVLSSFSISKAWEDLCSRGFEVWGYVCHLAEMENVPPLMHIIIIWLISISHQRTTRSIIVRLIVAATSYFLWLERNNHLFKNSRRSLEEV